MAIPSINFTNGVYFKTINGYKTSDFESAQRNRGVYFRRACTVQNKIKLFETDSSLIDTYSFAYLPYSSSSTDSKNSSYFARDTWSKYGIKPRIIIKSKSQGTYPFSLAFKNYRIMQGNCKTSAPGGTVCPFSIKTVEGAGPATITITKEAAGGTKWKDYNGNTITRNTCGIFLLAAGARGEGGGVNRDGGGGGGGGVFIGYFDLTKCSTITVYCSRYNSGPILNDPTDFWFYTEQSYISIDGQRVVTAYSGFVGSSGRSTDLNSWHHSGEIEVTSHPALITYHTKNGCYGGNRDDDNGQNFGPWTLSKVSPDDGNVTFAQKTGGRGKVSNSKGGGGGGASICGNGGDCGKNYNNGKAGGYGAGGGGGGAVFLWISHGGSGGNGVYLVGY